MELVEQSPKHTYVALVDAQAKLLSQALNRIQGEDDLGLRAMLLQQVLKELPQQEVLALLPESAESLQAMAAMGQESIAQHLQSWQQAQGARLKHLTFQLTPDQLAVVEAALTKIMPQAREDQGDSPNQRGVAIYLLCQEYLQKEGAR